MAYDPERWLNGDPEPSAFKFIAFNAGLYAVYRGRLDAYIGISVGPRLCLGQRMAYVEAEMLLAMIFQRYKVTVSPGLRNSVHLVLVIVGQARMQIMDSH
jgi:cytochrome P450